MVHSTFSYSATSRFCSRCAGHPLILGRLPRSVIVQRRPFRSNPAQIAFLCQLQTCFLHLGARLFPQSSHQTTSKRTPPNENCLTPPSASFTCALLGPRGNESTRNTPSRTSRTSRDLIQLSRQTSSRICLQRALVPQDPSWRSEFVVKNLQCECLRVHDAPG